jgi:hypothetical protein
MRLGYFTMPLHPMERSPTETLHEDREAIILADRLGFYDAFVGEHLTEKTENIMQAAALLAANPSPTDQEIVLGMNGNLCRCATYPRIVGAVKRASQIIKESNHG